MWTCNRLDLQTLGSQTVIMPKNLPDHWSVPGREVVWAYRVGQHPSDTKASQLHVDIFQFWLFYSFEVYSTGSSKIMGRFFEVLNINRLFLKLNRFICK